MCMLVGYIINYVQKNSYFLKTHKYDFIFF
jgi:hypothetical protein